MSSINMILKTKMLAPYKMINKISVGQGDGLSNPITKNLLFQNPSIGEIENNTSIKFDIPSGSTINRVGIYNDGRVFNPNQSEAPSQSTIYFDDYATLFSTEPTSSTQTAKFGKKFPSGSYGFILYELPLNKIPSNMIETISHTIVIAGGDYQNNMDLIYDEVESSVDYYTGSNIDCFVKVNVEDELGVGGSYYFVAIGSHGNNAFKSSSSNTFNVLYDTGDYVEPMVFEADSEIVITKVKIQIKEVEL